MNRSITIEEVKKKISGLAWLTLRRCLLVLYVYENLPPPSLFLHLSLCLSPSLLPLSPFPCPFFSASILLSLRMSILNVQHQC